MEKKLGSLFDGIGGFPLAAKRNGIRPVWASEIEKFPMAVTMHRFPEMKHMGDITKLHGENLPVVDVIAGGSPCQDLSIAGRRAGLAGMRSGLFLEQVRIIKEMRRQEERRKNSSGRRADVPVRPRYMVWENVPGAFSSGEPKGADFKRVLEEVCGIGGVRIFTWTAGWGMDSCRDYSGTGILCCLEGTGRSILGSPPETPKNLPYRRFWRPQCRRDII